MFDVHDFMKELSTKRPIFHSEADFQHAFAWQFHEQYENTSIRLEYPIAEEIHLDILVILDEIKLAFELKYRTKRFETEYNKEHFNLKNHSAIPQGRRAFLEDLIRLEKFKKDFGVIGYAILLTNDHQYWEQVKKPTKDIDFHLHRNRNLTGDLNWHGNPSHGTTRGKNEGLIISDNYYCEWEDYRNIEAPHLGFYYLALKI